MSVEMNIKNLRLSDSLTMMGIVQLPYIMANENMASLILRHGERMDFDSIDSALSYAKENGETDVYVELKSDWNNDSTLEIDGISVMFKTRENTILIDSISVKQTGSLVLYGCNIESSNAGDSLIESFGNLKITKDSKIFCNCSSCVSVKGGNTTIDGGIISGKRGITITGGSLVIPSESNARIIGTETYAVEIHPCESVSISNGTFNSYNGISIASLGSDGRKTGFVTGGQIDNEPSNDPTSPDYGILADGYLPRTPCRIVKSPYEQ